MAYITATRLEALMGSYDYDNCLSVNNGETADSTIVAAVIQRSDDFIDRYHTNLTTAEKESLSDDITPYFAYLLRGPGNIPDANKVLFGEAVTFLKQNQGVRTRPAYDPLDKPQQDYLDDTVADPE